MALGREKLIDNLRVAQERKSKDFVIGVADAWPREEDSEARSQFANDVRFVVLFIKDGEPHERSGDDRRAQEILNDAAARNEVAKDGANRFDRGGVGIGRRCLSRRSLSATDRAAAALLGDVRNQGSASCSGRLRTIQYPLHQSANYSLIKRRKPRRALTIACVPPKTPG